MNPAMFLCQPDVLNYLPPPNIRNLAKPALTFGPKDPSPWTPPLPTILYVFPENVIHV